VEEDRMPKKIFIQELEGTRRRGRPRKRWKEEVERDLQVLGVRIWRELVADRKKMEGHCSTGQSPQWTAVPMEEEQIFKTHTTFIKFLPAMAQQPPVRQGLLIIEDSPSHSDTPHSAGLLWRSDQPDAETST